MRLDKPGKINLLQILEAYMALVYLVREVPGFPPVEVGNTRHDSETGLPEDAARIAKSLLREHSDEYSLELVPVAIAIVKAATT